MPTLSVSCALSDKDNLLRPSVYHIYYYWKILSVHSDSAQLNWCYGNRNSKFLSCPRKTRRADNNRILTPCPAYFASCRTHSVCRNLRHPVFVPSFWFYNSISSDAESVSRWRCLPRCRSTRLPSMDKAQDAFIHPNDNYFRLRHPCRTTLFRSLVPAGIYSCNIIHIRTGSSSNKQIACADMP